MNVFLTTLKKELMSYFFSPVAYVIAVLFYLFRGFEVRALAGYFANLGADRDLFSTGYIFLQSSYFLIVLVPPILTMRCFAEERRSGSLESLMTAPVRDVEVVLGKWFAAVLFFAILLLPTILLLWVLTWPAFLATPLSFGPVLSGYLGMFLLGSFLLSVGCFTSSLTDNQLLASLGAMLFNIGLLSAVPMLGSLMGSTVSESYVGRVLLQQMNVGDHLGNWFSRGLVDTSQIVFYLGGCLFFLFLTVKSLESRKWR